MSGQGEVYDRVEGIVAKLYVLKDSCTGVIHTDKSNPNLIWFQGAEAMLQEAVGELQKALRTMETGEVGEPPATAETVEETETGSDEEQEEGSPEESE
ncbi:MAG: hypothetical protein PVF76_17180 [Syntrophobacterales bacterium]|jgi:hypothetical protein